VPVRWGTLVAMAVPPSFVADLGPGTVVPAPPSAIHEPVDRALLALLRHAVVDFSGSERRRVFPAAVHVGVPGGAVAVLPLGEQRLDHTLRTDALEAMVRRTRRPGPPPVVWLTRCGPRDVRDVDLAWLAAARTAAAELGQALPMVVVQRRSWRDPETGVGREWARIRTKNSSGPGVDGVVAVHPLAVVEQRRP
jgi:hypothetical protein